MHFKPTRVNLAPLSNRVKSKYRELQRFDIRVIEKLEQRLCSGIITGHRAKSLIFHPPDDRYLRKSNKLSLMSDITSKHNRYMAVDYK